jgi:hypothetical protein
MQGFGTLEWTFTPLQHSIDFLDLTIFQTTMGTIGTKLFEKALNSYLYLPSHSAHAPGVLTGLVNGMITRIARLTTNRSDINDNIQNFYDRLSRRGYKPYVLQKLFNDTIDRLNIALKLLPQNSQYTSSLKLPQNNNRNEQQDGIGRQLILHLTYSPHDPSSSVIQQLFRDTVLNPPNDTLPVAKIRNKHHVECNITRLTIAYSRHLNLGNLLSVRKIKDNPAPVTAFLTTTPTHTADRGELVNDAT